MHKLYSNGITVESGTVKLTGTNALVVRRAPNWDTADS